jgi:RNA polymerase primary sigma factor
MNLYDLRKRLGGRRFLGVAELEQWLPIGAGVAQIEDVLELLDDLAVVLVHEERRRPVAYSPAWNRELWSVVEKDMSRGSLGVRAYDPAVEDAHAIALGLEPDAPEEPETTASTEEEAEEPLEDPSERFRREAIQQERLGEEELEAMAARAAGGDSQARDAIVDSYLGRVIYLARRYRKAGASQDDLIQAGNLGLLEAIASFRPEGRRSFRNHADRAVRHAFGRHLAEERRTIRLPQSVDKEIRRMLREHERLTRKKEGPPSHAELADAMDLPVDEVDYLMSYLQAPLSLDGPTAPGDTTRLEEVLEDTRAAAPSTWSARASALRRLEEILEELSVSHRRVVALRYGLVDGIDHDQQAVGVRVGMSADEVARLEAEALEVLRRSSDLGSLA